jgi:hypothetical protein
LKDTLLPKDANTKWEQATISYEFNFKVPGNAFDEMKRAFIVMPWSKFEPTYRGKPKQDAPALDTKNIRRFSILMRRYSAMPMLGSGSSCTDG